jgi:hypothetical protein
MTTLYALGAVVAALFAALFGAWKKGKSDATEVAARRDAEARAAAGKERAHAEADVAASADPADELRRNWSRR